MNWKAGPVIAILVVVASTSMVYAFFVSTRFGATVVVSNPLMLFTDAACTTQFVGPLTMPATFAGQIALVTMYLHLAVQTVTLQWNSTIVAATGGHITDFWRITVNNVVSPLNGTSVTSGPCYVTQYLITADLHTPSGSYSWTLTLGYT